MTEERQGHLREYLLACVRSSVLSWADLTSPKVLDKFLKVLSKDVKVVIKDLGRTGVTELLGMGMTMLAGMATNAATKRR